jgi:multiple sugar transport system ATP-binding protein
VTHDQIEAMTMGDRVAVMKDGVLQQCDTPLSLYDGPRNLFVAGFIGSPAMNFIPCRLEESDGGLRVRLGDNIALPVPASRAGRYKPYVGRDGLTFGLRPEHLTEAKSEAKSNGSGEHALIDATLEVTEPLGMETLVFFHINGVDVCARVSPNAGAREGVRMKLDARLENMHLIDDTTGRVL